VSELLEPRSLLTAGALDATFGGDGIAMAHVAFTDEGYAVAVQGDGSVLVAGGADVRDVAPYGGDFVVARFTPAGELDTSFGQAGVVREDFGSNDRAEAVLVQPDGKIVLGGWTGQDTPFNYDYALVRYNPDGTRDPSFGTGGRVVTNFGDRTDDRMRALALQPDGKIVAVGRGSPDNFTTALGVARYNPDGSLDSSFATGGLYSTRILSNSSTAYDVVIQADQKILMLAEAASGGPLGGFQTLAMLRLLPDGRPDGSFGGLNGVKVDPVGVFQPGAIEVDVNGGIYAAGMLLADDQVPSTSVFKYTANGNVDPNYGAVGRLDVARGGFIGNRVGTVLQPDGKLVVATTTDGPTWTVARVMPNGTPDPTFGIGGKITVVVDRFAGNVVGDVALAPTGDVVVGGASYSSDSGTRDLTAARFLGDARSVPGVEQVSVSSSHWTQPFLRALAGPGAGPAGFALSADPAHPSFVPWPDVDRVSVRFSNDVSLVENDLRLTGSRGSAYPTAGFVYDHDSRTATWTLAAPLPLDRILAQIRGGPRAFAVAPGDATLNGRVDALDLGEVKRRLNSTTTSSAGPGYSPFADLTGDGRVNALDLGAVKRRLNTRVPDASVAPAALPAPSRPLGRLGDDHSVTIAVLG
jgi:uncharacterized delta-60 repeat protein